MFTGPITVEQNRSLRDLSVREIVILAPLVALIVFLGIYPKPALERIEPSVDAILHRIEQTTDYRVPDFGAGVEITVGEQGE
jgi:NADH-quinone oxidoreductase subunit M